MPGREPSRPDYEQSVFINCPFDDDYRPLFHAVVFTVHVLGLVPRCSLEASDSGSVRIQTIISLIEYCRWGIHDISRTELNANGLPRFNMPLELGIFLGAQRLGSRSQKRKSCLVLDRDPYRYQEFISDIAGQDIASHGGEPVKAISAVRNWLATSMRNQSFPGGRDIGVRFRQFQRDLPGTCLKLKIQPDELTFAEYSRITFDWLIDNLTT